MKIAAREVNRDLAISAAARQGLPRSAWAWSIYEGARTPYVILIKVYVFIPYFAVVLVGNAVAGQALVAKLVMGYGLFGAITSPLLGAAMDRIGPRKPLLGLITAVMITLIASLWWATPDQLGLTATCIVLFAAGVLFGYTEVLHNSLLPFAGPPPQTSATSGLGLALGSGLSVILLIIVLWAFALPAKMAAPFLPAAPLFGLSANAHETDRIVAPIVAIVFALGALPLFLIGRDAPRGAGGGVGASFRQLGATLRALPTNRPMAIFLGSRMLYTDGMTAILLFTGVYAAGVMHWGAIDLTAFAILTSCFLAIGGLIGGRLDRSFGPRRAIQVELCIVIVGQLLMLGIAPDRLVYVTYHGGPIWHGPVIRTLPEMAFAVIGCFNAVGICGCYASSRSMVTRLCTPATIGSWFGLYALSGTATIWLGSAVVALATSVVRTQQAGFVALIGLVLIGLAGISFVQEPDHPKRGARPMRSVA